MDRVMTLEEVRQLEDLLTKYQVLHASERELTLLKSILPPIRRRLTRMQGDAKEAAQLAMFEGV